MNILLQAKDICFNYLNFLFFQQFNGKKQKRGPFNGRAKILIASLGDNDNYNYGFKNKKCIKVYSELVRSISGTFVNDAPHGICKSQSKNLSYTHNLSSGQEREKWTQIGGRVETWQTIWPFV